MSSRSSRSGSIDSSSFFPVSSDSPSYGSLSSSNKSNPLMMMAGDHHLGQGNFSIQVSRAYTSGGGGRRRELSLTKWTFSDWVLELLDWIVSFLWIWNVIWFGLFGLLFWPLLLSFAYCNAIGHHIAHAQDPWDIGNWPLGLLEVIKLNIAIFHFYLLGAWETLRKVDLSIILHYYDIKPLNDFKIIKDLQYSLDQSDVTLDLYLPLEKEEEKENDSLLDGSKRPVLIFIYGGGWHAGEKNWYYGLARTWVLKGYIVVIPKYSDFPTSIEVVLGQVRDCIHWTHDHIHEFGGDNSKLILMGHSAGAHMAALTVIRGFSDQQQPQIQKTNFNSPSTSLINPWTASIKHVILLAGIYDVSDHFEHERERAVHKISKMARVFGRAEEWSHYSPKKWLKRHFSNHQSKLRGRGGGVGVSSSSKTRSSTPPPFLDYSRSFPSWTIIHGDKDITVPISSSYGFVEYLRKSVFNAFPHAISFMTLTNGTHVDPVYAMVSEKAPFHQPIYQKLSSQHLMK